VYNYALQKHQTSGITGNYYQGLFETYQHAQSAGLLTVGRHNFSLKSVRIPAKKLLASGPKSLAAGHIANVQTSP